MTLDLSQRHVSLVNTDWLCAVVVVIVVIVNLAKVEVVVVIILALICDTWLISKTHISGQYQLTL